MRKWIKISGLFLVFMLPVTVQAEDYIYTTNLDNTITITGYIGSGGPVVVPSNIVGRTVASIGDQVFYESASLTGVTIPDSVISIGAGAFGRCTSLTSVTIPDSVTSIGEGAFVGCTSLTTTIPDSVTNIGVAAFAGCVSLTSITIPDGVTSIGETVFASCTSLTNVMIGNSVTSLGGFMAFYNCTSLTSITIPDSVTSIGEAAFLDCTSLTNVMIGNSVTSIEDGAFSGCTGLMEVYFRGNAPNVGRYAFDSGTGTVYRMADATGWPTVPNSWAGHPTALWDSDADGISDPWEQQYFGSSTNANPGAICSNGINTIREAYIAGLNPNDPQSMLRATAPSTGKEFCWNAASGRVYSVYFSTNLMSGFQCLESNIPWTQASFTNSTTAPCGYYKINVRLAE